MFGGVNQTNRPQQRKYNIDKEAERLPSRRIVIPMDSDTYEETMESSVQARVTIDHYLSVNPELFPTGMEQGYILNGWTERSKKMEGSRFRRVKIENEDGKQVAYTVMPCDVLPYLTGKVFDVEKALFLKRFGVPDWALTYLFGRSDSYWYRLSQSFGRVNVVGTTIKQADKLPSDLLADEKHAKAHGGTWYIATTVGNDCVLGASVSTTADAAGLQEAYAVFKEEARAVSPDYQPKTVNTDGWASTIKAWETLFPQVVVILCFLHAFIKIRSRCKRLGELYDDIKQQVWTIYHTTDRAMFNAEVDVLKQWVQTNRQKLTNPALTAIDKLCRRADQFCLAYDHPTAYRTSNMLDRHMEPMARWLANGRHFHGHRSSADLRVRGWALFHNYQPYCPRAKISQSFHSPAHKLNGFIYRDNWLENLLVASSCQGFRHKHRKKQN